MAEKLKVFTGIRSTQVVRLGEPVDLARDRSSLNSLGVLVIDNETGRILARGQIRLVDLYSQSCRRFVDHQGNCYLDDLVIQLSTLGTRGAGKWGHLSVRWNITCLVVSRRQNSH